MRKKARPDPALAACGCGKCIVCDLFIFGCTGTRAPQVGTSSRGVHYNPMGDPEASLVIPEESDQEEW